MVQSLVRGALQHRSSNTAIIGIRQARARRRACFDHAVLDPSWNQTHQFFLLGHRRGERGVGLCTLTSKQWPNRQQVLWERAQLKSLLHRLDQQESQADAATYARLLQICGKLKALPEGKRIHAHIIRSGLESHTFLADLLVNMYGKCGSLEDARRMFEKKHPWNVVACTTMIAAYAQHGLCKQALQLFGQMQREDLKPNRITFITLLNACARPEALVEGRVIHAHIIESGFESNVVVGNALITMYGKCGSVKDARKMFDKIPQRNLVSWNAMIAAYAQRGHGKEALRLFRRVQLEGIKPNKITFLAVLNACSSPTVLAEGKMVHGRIIESGFMSDIVVGSALVTMYGKCGSLENARNIFDTMHERDVVSWNAMIAAYAQHEHVKEARYLFRQMRLEGVKPDKVTFVSILSACASPFALEEGKMIHACVIDCGLESNVSVGSALVSMYGKCGSLEDAKGMFNKMHKLDVVSWTAMIGAYCQHGHGKEAIRLFYQMQLEGVKPNKITFVSTLSACASLRDLAEGKRIHACIVETGFESEVDVGNALVSMYRKCGSLEDAWRMFDKMHQRDVVSWTAILGAYAELGLGKVALQLFQQMQLEGFKPNRITFITVLEACASLAALGEGKMVHAQIVETGLELEVDVGNALVNMYGKCGSLKDARRMFDKMQQRDVISWTAMITGYALHGYGDEALQLFWQMQQEGVKPNSITFVSILSACSHAGLLDEGCRHFVSMSKDYGITPNASHYGCMIDLFGRAGWLDKAENIINRMPVQPDAVAWMTLLGACRNHGDVERGKRAAEHVLDLDPLDAAAYVVLSNIYADAGRWSDAAKVRRVMLDRGVKKQPGLSSIEIKNRVHEFVMGDRSHPQTEEIYAELTRLSRQMKEGGYVPDTKLVLHDLEEGEKEQLVCCHSEMLAIAFGLINTPHGTHLRLIKNLRVCSNCHTATKLISKIVGREIVVRDAKRFHHFKDAMCSCGDYW